WRESPRPPASSATGWQTPSTTAGCTRGHSPAWYGKRLKQGRFPVPTEACDDPPSDFVLGTEPGHGATGARARAEQRPPFTAVRTSRPGSGSFQLAAVQADPAGGAQGLPGPPPLPLALAGGVPRLGRTRRRRALVQRVRSRGGVQEPRPAPVSRHLP